MKSSSPAGPFVPTIRQSTRISMAGDDCSLHFDLDKLTRKQQQDHYSNQVLTGMLQVALLYIGKAADEICLYDTFNTPLWRPVLQRYHRMFGHMGLEPVPMANLRFHPFDDYYQSVAGSPTDTELETLYMTSGRNRPVHRDDIQLSASRNLNSKAHFAVHAPRFGLSVPDTLSVTRLALGGPAVVEFFARHPPPLMLKTLGLAGARNVTTVASIEAARAYVAEYNDDMPVILQARLDTADYTEMTVDLFVSDDDIHVTNVRKILFADGLWVGNLMGSAVALPQHHEQALLKVGEYARHHGYTTALGFNLGIDYFIRNDAANSTLPELLVTEVNARWTGGLFPAELVRRLKVNDKPVVAFIDMCPCGAFADYLAFVEANLPGGPEQQWAIAPMGFAPFEMEMDGGSFYFVWQAVTGDFAAFKKATEGTAIAAAMPTAYAITV